MKKQPNTTCATCGKAIFRWPYMLKRSKRHFCNVECKGIWTTDNCLGEKSYNWRGGSWTSRTNALAHTPYRRWRKHMLDGAVCIFCSSETNLELHHIKTRSEYPELIREESNVVPMCASCHDVFHSNTCKGGELRERLSVLYIRQSAAKLGKCTRVTEKVQRLMGEDATNKPDTSAAPERDDIVRACMKMQEVLD